MELIMEDKIIQELKRKKIDEMISPTILMNDIDFNSFKDKLESTVTGFKVLKNPTFQGVPVKTSFIVPKGLIVVYDSANEMIEQINIC